MGSNGLSTCISSVVEHVAEHVAEEIQNQNQNQVNQICSLRKRKHRKRKRKKSIQSQSNPNMESLLVRSLFNLRKSKSFVDWKTFEFIQKEKTTVIIVKGVGKSNPE